MKLWDVASTENLNTKLDFSSSDNVKFDGAVILFYFAAKLFLSFPSFLNERCWYT